MDISDLRLRMASLLRAAQPKNPRPQAVDIARAAAPLLGLASASAKDVPSPPLSAFARQRSATPVAKPEGVVARLRKLFGKS